MKLIGLILISLGIFGIIFYLVLLPVLSHIWFSGIATLGSPLYIIVSVVLAVAGFFLYTGKRKD